MAIYYNRLSKHVHATHITHMYSKACRHSLRPGSISYVGRQHVSNARNPTLCFIIPAAINRLNVCTYIVTNIGTYIVTNIGIGVLRGKRSLKPTINS